MFIAAANNQGFLFISFVKGHCILVNTILSFHSLSPQPWQAPRTPLNLLSVSLGFVCLCIITASCQRRTGRRTSGITSVATQTTRPAAPGASPPTPWSGCRPVVSRSARRVSTAEDSVYPWPRPAGCALSCAFCTLAGGHYGSCTGFCFKSLKSQTCWFFNQPCSFQTVLGILVICNRRLTTASEPGNIPHLKEGDRALISFRFI